MTSSDHIVDDTKTARVLTRAVVRQRSSAGLAVLGLPIWVRLKMLVNSARIENVTLSLIRKLRPKLKFSCGRRA